MGRTFTSLACSLTHSWCQATPEPGTSEVPWAKEEKEIVQSLSFEVLRRKSAEAQNSSC